MKGRYTSRDGRITIEFEAAKYGGVVKHLAQIQDIVENQECQACIDDERDPKQFGVNFDFRISQGYSFYAMRCQHPDCGAKLEFGQKKDESGGGLFVKRWDSKTEKDIEHRGWSWYKKEGGGPAEKTAPASGGSREVDEDEIPF